MSCGFGGGRPTRDKWPCVFGIDLKLSEIRKKTSVSTEAVSQMYLRYFEKHFPRVEPRWLIAWRDDSNPRYPLQQLNS